ncbi:MAG TPA: hypothetical protein VN756_10270 [Solirubrobacterales bacterium]|nr:hypothetical protein [Solirubrobacterales bacterium]
MTWIIFSIGLLLPIAGILIAPSLPSIKRMAGVDQASPHRVYLSRQLLVVDEQGRSDVPELEKTPAVERAEQYELWWMRQPMRTGDSPLAVNELAVSPISVVSEESRAAAIKNKPARMKVRTGNERSGTGVIPPLDTAAGHAY